MRDLNQKPYGKLFSIDGLVVGLIMLAIVSLYIFLTQGKAPAVNIVTVILGAMAIYLLILVLIAYLAIRLIMWAIKKVTGKEKKS